MKIKGSLQIADPTKRGVISETKTKTVTVKELDTLMATGALSKDHAIRCAFLGQVIDLYPENATVVLTDYRIV